MCHYRCQFPSFNCASASFQSAFLDILIEGKLYVIMLLNPPQPQADRSFVSISSSMRSSSPLTTPSSSQSSLPHSSGRNRLILQMPDSTNGTNSAGKYTYTYLHIAICLDISPSINLKCNIRKSLGWKKIILFRRWQAPPALLYIAEIKAP